MGYRVTIDYNKLIDKLIEMEHEQFNSMLELCEKHFKQNFLNKADLIKFNELSAKHETLLDVLLIVNSLRD